MGNVEQRIGAASASDLARKNLDGSVVRKKCDFDFRRWSGGFAARAVVGRYTATLGTGASAPLIAAHFTPRSATTFTPFAGFARIAASGSARTSRAAATVGIA